MSISLKLNKIELLVMHPFNSKISAFVRHVMTLYKILNYFQLKNLKKIFHEAGSLIKT